MVSEKLRYSNQFFFPIAVHQFQGILERVFFSVDSHPAQGQSKLFKRKGAASVHSIECTVVQQCLQDAHGGDTTGE